MRNISSKRIAKKYGVVRNHTGGHGGARGNGAHLSSNAKSTSEHSKREESRIKVALQKES